MVIKIDKLRQAAASFLVILSLFVSSVSACACAHHNHPKQLKAEESSCHREKSHEQAETQDSDDSVSFSGDIAAASCECVLDTAAKVFAKNEKLKIGKQAALSISNDKSPVLVFTRPLDLSAGFYSPRIFVSDPFYNLMPGRAPPRLQNLLSI
jgi:hypothetical protein